MPSMQQAIAKDLQLTDAETGVVGTAVFTGTPQRGSAEVVAAAWLACTLHGLSSFYVEGFVVGTPVFTGTGGACRIYG